MPDLNDQARYLMAQPAFTRDQLLLWLDRHLEGCKWMSENGSHKVYRNRAKAQMAVLATLINEVHEACR